MEEQGIVRINSDRCEINEKGELICETPENTQIEEERDILVTDNPREDKPKPKPQHRREKPQTHLAV